MEPGKPLTFLDHHIVSGNGIIGATPAMIIDGVPDDAFLAKPKEGDDRSTCTRHKQRNARSREGQASLFTGRSAWQPANLSTKAAGISALPDRTIVDVQAKSEAWSTFTSSEDLTREQLMADAYCAAVTFPRSEASKSWTVAPYDLLYELRDHPDADLPEEAVTRVSELAARYRFLHWHLTFPEVFGSAGAGTEDERCGWTGGFDVVLGNPPWDTLSPDRKEFFKSWLPEIASLSSDDQGDAIDDALVVSPQLRHRWDSHRLDLFATSRFFRRSTRAAVRQRHRRQHPGKSQCCWCK